jgi:hypothetical protein
MENIKDLLGRFGIQVAGRFVGNQQGGIIGQSAGNGGAPLLPARHHAGQFPRLVGQPDHIQKMQRPLAPRLGRVHT